MLRSMTGFGSATSALDGLQLMVEVRAVNNKYYKGTLRLPESLLPLEATLEAQLARRITRGSVQLTVRTSGSTTSSASTINETVLRAYVDQAERALVGTRVAPDLSAFLSLPGVVNESADGTMLDLVRAALPPLVDEACDALIAMRAREGAALREVLLGISAEMRRRLQDVQTRVPEVIVVYADRLRQRLNALLTELNSSAREEDILREVAVFAERSDIAEEITRLLGHCDQFEQLLSPGLGEPVGRTLDFLSQEMLREANTIASKSSDMTISRAVVDIKTSIDRIKEQAQNVE